MSELAIQIEKSRLEHYLRQFGPTLRKNLGAAIGRSITEMARTWRRLAPKAHSTYVNSIVASQSLDGLEGTARAGVNYAQAVELGTGRYGPAGRASGRFPPLQPLLDWIRVKRIVPDDPNTDVEDLAWLFARSIAMRGTPKQPAATPAFEQHKEAATRRLERAIALTLARA